LNIANALVFKLNQTDITSHIVLLLSLVWAETVVRISGCAKRQETYMLFLLGITR
jgi:hypothetical protein